MPVVKTSKEEIVIKAAQLFRRQGYFNTSISQLAGACGVRNALLYYHFKDKDDLLKETLKYATEYFSRKAFRYAYNEEMTPHERVRKITNIAERLFLGNQGGCLAAVTVLETSHLNMDFLNNAKQFFETWINALACIYQTKHTNEEALELAERQVQDIEGGIMLTMLYREEKYLMKALERTRKVLD